MGPTKVKLAINADAADMEPVKRHVLGHYRQSVQIPGFRAGSAPLAMIEKQIDQKALLDEFLEHALNQFYGQAVKHENLRPVGQPNVQLKKFVPFSDLLLEVETETIGDVILPDYKKIKIQKIPVKITAADVNEVVKSLQQRAAERRSIERPAKKGDEVIIDFSGKDKENKPVAGADGNDYPLILGNGSFIPGFENNLFGVKTGETTDFAVKFPSDYAVTALQNKNVNFKVKVNKVNELTVPKVDDAFASKVGPFKTVLELKTDVKKQLQVEKKQQADRDFENRLIGEIVAKSKVDIPESMIEQDILRLEDEEKRNLTYRGQTWQEHLKEEGVTEEEHREKQKLRAEERIKTGIVLGEIADRENITATGKEIDERLELLKDQYQDEAMRTELDKPQIRRDIESRILTEKTISKLVSYSR